MQVSLEEITKMENIKIIFSLNILGMINLMKILLKLFKQLDSKLKHLISFLKIKSVNMKLKKVIYMSKEKKYQIYIW